MPYFQMCGVKMCAGIWVSLWFFTTAPIILNCFDSYCYWLYIRYRMEFNRFLAGTAFSSAIQHSFTVQFLVEKKKTTRYILPFSSPFCSLCICIIVFISFLFNSLFTSSFASFFFWRIKEEKTNRCFSLKTIWIT